MATFFAADIGGTKSELAIYQRTGPDLPLLQKRYSNAEFSGFEEIIKLFLEQADKVPQFGCIALAGVVTGDRARLTNLPWEIDSRLLEKHFGFQEVVLINDLTAVCSSLAVLGPDDLLEIQPGKGAGGEIRGVLAPGTGLGEGLLVEVDGNLLARGTEGGHTDFGPVDDEQLALLAWMQEKEKPVSYEMLIAGPGLANLYGFYRQYHQIPETVWVVEAMAGVKDKIPVIVAGAVSDNPCPLCRGVVDLFLSILGSEAGNLALKLYAKGGIYLGGGILPRLVGKIRFDSFLKSFHTKGQMSGFMEDIAVNLILRKDAALIGAANYVRQGLNLTIHK